MNPADWQRIQGPGGDPFQSLLTMLIALICLLGGPVFCVAGTALGTLGGAVHAIVVRQAPALVLAGDDESEW